MLNEITCRNRQPRRAVPSNKPDASECTGTGLTADKSMDSGKGASGRFKFNRSKAPCFSTQAVRATTAQPALITLEIDKFATQGAVFPRAHVGGISCKPARGVLHFGKHQRHLQWFYVKKETRNECYTATGTNPYLSPAAGCLKKGDCPQVSPQGSNVECGKGESAGTARSIAYWLANTKPVSGTGFCGGANRNRQCLLSCSSPEICPSCSTCQTCDAVAGEACEYQPYFTFLWGKGEMLTASEGGYRDGANSGNPALGKFQCAAGDTACSGAIANGRVPDVARTDPTRGLATVTAHIDSLINTTVGSTTGYSQLTKPFFMWYAPKIPHGIENPEESFRDLYPNLEDATGDSTKDHFGRVSWFDRGVAALTEHLKKTCICGRNPSGNSYQKQSLFENTVFIALADQGFFLPNGKYTSADNTHRTPLVISTPRHRAASSALTPRALPNELAHSIDVLPTALAYGDAGVRCTQDSDCAPDDERCQYTDSSQTNKYCVYRFGRNLRPTIEDPNTPHLRDMQFGQKGTNQIAQSDTAHDTVYVIPRPGLLGVCDPGANYTSASVGSDASYSVTSGNDGAFGSSQGFRHLRLCLTGSTCPSGDACVTKQCANRPDMACTSDRDCASATTSGSAAAPKINLCNSTCSGSSCCSYSLSSGSFADYAIYSPSPTIPGQTPPNPRACSSSTPEQCVPKGTCRPTVFKIQGLVSVDKSQNPPAPAIAIKNVYDLNYDPDENYDLMKLNILPSSGSNITSKLTDCLYDFWNVDGTSRHWKARSSTTCPWTP